MEKRPIAYQVYSARDDAQKDLSGVLAQLAEMGYDGVEFAGFYGHSADAICEMLKKHGLKAISSHVALALIEKDMFGVIAFHKQIGCEYIAIPYLDDATRPGAAGFAATLRTVCKFGALCREAGIQLLYHNHDFEFVTVSGQFGLDFLYDAIPAEQLATELDVCWVTFAGQDPVAYVKKYAGRAPVVHLKDFIGGKGGKSPYALIGLDEGEDHSSQAFKFKPVGHGCVNIQGVVEAGIASGTRWFVVEQDLSYEQTALEAAKDSIDALKKIGVK